MFETTAWQAETCFEDGPTQDGDVPIWLVRRGDNLDDFGWDATTRAWLDTQAFTGGAKTVVQVPDASGGLSAIVFGMGNGGDGEPSGPSSLLLGQLARTLPARTYRFANAPDDATLAAIAWGMGAYAFKRYLSSASDDKPCARLRLPKGCDRARVLSTVEAVWLGRDLINTPASDLGPAEIETAIRLVGARHGAHVTSVVGDDLLEQNYPMIHAVGRASSRPPRIVDLQWGDENAKKITLVGKGISFDTGGLDIKPASAMLLMKKDMGGAATALTLAHMIMAAKLPCRLRLIVATAENAISGDAFRPSDVLMSRAGMTVEVGNTDAEGRLVLADALALADEEVDASIYVFATLTGAARSALGPDLPAFFTDDEALGTDLPDAARSIGDPLWRMPLWPGYARNLKSDVADTNNVWESPFAGAITAALFLRKFVRNARSFAHFDLYGWRPQPRPTGPKGGEPQTARAVFEHLRRELIS